jgi:hypothetical protein
MRRCHLTRAAPSLRDGCMWKDSRHMLTVGGRECGVQESDMQALDERKSLQNLPKSAQLTKVPAANPAHRSCTSILLHVTA